MESEDLEAGSNHMTSRFQQLHKGRYCGTMLGGFGGKP